MKKEQRPFFLHSFPLHESFLLSHTAILFIAIYRKKTYGPDWRAIIAHAAPACIASVPSNRRPARCEIHSASLSPLPKMISLELMPQGMVATRRIDVCYMLHACEFGNGSMGIELASYTLYELKGIPATCEHFLLLRVTRPAYSNTIQAEEDWANDVLATRQRLLLDFYVRHLLPQECLHAHEIYLEGEFQDCPPGDDLYSDHGMRFLDIWIASTRFGYPWIVLGMAESADAFWQEITEDFDLAILQVRMPVTQRHVFFLTEHDRPGNPFSVTL